MTGEASAASLNQNISVEKVTVVDPRQRQVGESNLQTSHHRKRPSDPLAQPTFLPRPNHVT